MPKFYIFFLYIHTYIYLYKIDSHPVSKRGTLGDCWERPAKTKITTDPNVATGARGKASGLRGTRSNVRGGGRLRGSVRAIAGRDITAGFGLV